MKFEVFAYDLQLKDKFETSHGARLVQPTLIVKLSHEGYYGLGEAAATSYYGQTVTKMERDIHAQRKRILAHRFENPTQFYDLLLECFPTNSFIRCAFDVAAHDIYSKINNTQLYRLLELDIAANPISNYTIGLDTIENMTHKVQSFAWPIYKIKLGTKNDIEIVKTLRGATSSLFRIDANGGWHAEETIENAEHLRAMDVEFIEQPLPADRLNDMLEVKKHSVLPLIADESCHTLEDVDTCGGLFDGINVKLTKAGGITPALKMIHRARQLDMTVMMGCMTESSVGISAIAHLMPMLDYVDLDGALLIRNDPAEGIWFDDQYKVRYPSRNGIGATLKRLPNDIMI